MELTFVIGKLLLIFLPGYIEYEVSFFKIKSDIAERDLKYFSRISM